MRVNCHNTTLLQTKKTNEGSEHSLTLSSLVLRVFLADIEYAALADDYFTVITDTLH